MIEVKGTSSELVYKTTHSAFLQIDHTESFSLYFAGTHLPFRLCELILFKRKIQQIDVTRMLLGEIPDVEIIELKHCNRLLSLGIWDVLELREVLSGAFTMLELNSMIHKILLRKPI